MEILVTRMQGKAVGEGPMEIVERKGIGHPDSLCDRAAEELSIALSRHYLERYGRILHHNVDKAVLVGGISNATFGGGRVTTPMKLIFVGRATARVGRDRIPVKELAVETGRRVFTEALPHLDPEHLKVECQVRPGSRDLVTNFDREDLPASNDTSLGVGFAPLTDTEKVVRAVEFHLNGAAMTRKHPEWGQDVKVMGTRVGGHLNLTVALAFVAKFVPDFESYEKSREQATLEALKVARRHTSLDVTVEVNRADVGESVYLTVTGTSAEMGDDGQVGRGNRVNGIITPYRPMTLEAAAGKNPTSHVGKIYNFTADDIAKALVRKDGIDGVHVYLVSQIGAPVNEPQALEIRVQSALRKGEIEEIGRKAAARALKAMPTLWKRILDGKHPVC